MSGVIDETFAITGELIAGTAEACAAVLAGLGMAAGATAIGAYKAGEFAVEKSIAAAKALYNMDQETSLRINEYNEAISKSIKSIENQLMEYKIKDANQSEENRKNHVAFLHNEINKNIHFSSGILSEDFTELTELLETSNHVIEIESKIKNIMLQIELDDSFQEIEKEIEFAVLNKSFDSIKEYMEYYSNLIALSKKLNAIVAEKEKTERAKYENINMSDLVINIAYEKGAFIKLLLREDLAELFEIHREDEALMYENMLQELLSDSLEEYNRLLGLENLEDISVYEQLMDSIIKTFEDEVYSPKTTYDLVKERKDLLEDHYLKQKSRNEKRIEQLDHLHELLLVNITLREELNMKIRKFSLEADLDEVIFEVEEDIDFLYAEKLKLEQSRAIQKQMKEMLLGKQYEHFSTTQRVTKNGIELSEYYHMENGVMLRVRTNTNGDLISTVSGVSMPGLASKKEDLIDSQKKFCSDYDDIRDELVNDGLELELLHRFEPDDNIAYDMFSQEEFTPYELQKIKSFRMAKQQQEATLKRRYMK